VDAVFLDDAAWVRTAALAIYERHQGEVGDLDANWLNDGVKGWLSRQDRESKTLFRSYPSEDDVGLRVFVATPEYIFAMKCMAMRLGQIEGRHDVGDIVQLANHLKIENADQALEIISKYYPKNEIQPKTQFGVEEIFENLAEDAELRTGGRSPWGL
jgi:hypothetical protein